jgi:hypothetical protein
MPFVIKNMGQWITENSFGFLKTDSMLVDILIRFSLVPFKFQTHLQKAPGNISKHRISGGMKSSSKLSHSGFQTVKEICEITAMRIEQDNILKKIRSCLFTIQDVTPILFFTDPNPGLYPFPPLFSSVPSVKILF